MKRGRKQAQVFPLIAAIGASLGCQTFGMRCSVCCSNYDINEIAMENARSLKQLIFIRVYFYNVSSEPPRTWLYVFHYQCYLMDDIMLGFLFLISTGQPNYPLVRNFKWRLLKWGKCIYMLMQNQFIFLLDKQS